MKRQATHPIATLLLNLNLATLFGGMILALVFRTVTDSSEAMAMTMGAVLGAVGALTVALDACGMARSPARRGIMSMVAVITFMGLPGLLLHSYTDVTITTYLFLLLLAVRNYICFFGIPLSRTAGARPLERSILSWTLAAFVIVVIGTLLIARNTGISLASSERMSGNTNSWLNPNAGGEYCAFALLICAMASFFPRWIRILVAAAALYALILTQSRTATIALVAGLGMNLALVFARRKLIGICVACVAALGMTVWAGDLMQIATNFPQITTFMNRMQGISRFQGREEVLRQGLDLFWESPIFGHGYFVVNARFENGYLSLACETGIVGLFLYLLFLVRALWQARQLLKTPDNTRAHRVGHYLACTTVFIIVHAMGERTNGFQIASPVSNLWAVLCGLAFTLNPSARQVALKEIHSWVRRPIPIGLIQSPALNLRRR